MKCLLSIGVLMIVAATLPAQAERTATNEELKAELARPVEKIELENGPIKDALAFLRDRYDIPIRINVKAFQTAGIEDVMNEAVALPLTKGKPLGEVLIKILEQVKGKYQIKDGKVWIVPNLSV